MSSKIPKHHPWPPPWYFTRHGWWRFLFPKFVLPKPKQWAPSLILHFALGILATPMWLLSLVRPRSAPRRILWVGRYHLGDFLMSSPGLRTLRRNLPSPWIGIVLQDRYIGQFDLSEVADAEIPEIDETLPFFEQVNRWRRRYRELEIDCVIFHRVTRPDLPAVLGAFLEQLPHRVGGADKGLQSLLTDVYCPSRREKVANYSQHLVENWLGLPAKAFEWPTLLHPSAQETQWDVLIAPFPQHSKLWPQENWRSLLEAFRSRSLRVALSAGPSAAVAARELLEGYPWVENLSERPVTLEGLFDLVRSARTLVSIDTGIRHIAAALGVPCVVIANEREHRDVIGGYVPTERFLVHDVPCAPCGAEPCPLGHLRCVRGISPDLVLAAWEELRPGIQTTE